MNFFCSIISSFKNTFQLTGRSPRADLLYYWLFLILFHFIIGFIAGIMEISLEDMDIITFYPSIIIAVPILALSVRRVHDINKSGWWILPKFLTFVISCFLSHYQLSHQWQMAQMPVLKLLIVIGGVYCLFLLFFLLRKGDQNINEYGPPAVK